MRFLIKKVHAVNITMDWSRYNEASSSNNIFGGEVGLDRQHIEYKNYV